MFHRITSNGTQHHPATGHPQSANPIVGDACLTAMTRPPRPANADLHTFFDSEGGGERGSGNFTGGSGLAMRAGNNSAARGSTVGIG